VDHQPPGALETLRAEASRRGAPFIVAAPSWEGPVALRGPHQRGNAALASAALRALAREGVEVGEEAVARGIARARWPGRLEELGDVLLDGAHNPDGAAALAAALPTLHPGRPVELVFGVLSDKDHAGMLRALVPVARRLHLVAPATPRARAAESLLAEARALGADADAHPGLADAIACARRAAADGALVCVAGSLYLVGEARALLGAGIPPSR
jgi:dihydrofolate synthase/folylpolyglutamate synthase